MAYMFMLKMYANCNNNNILYLDPKNAKHKLCSVVLTTLKIIRNKYNTHEYNPHVYKDTDVTQLKYG